MRAPSPRLVFVSLALATCSVACGDDSVAEPTPLALEDFAGAHKTAMCGYLARCGIVADADACDTLAAHDRGVLQSVVSVGVGELDFDPAAAKSCLAAIDAQGCDGGSLVPRVLREACDGVFTQRLGEGEPCYHPAQCQGLDASCEGACIDACCVGACKLSALIALGAACDGSVACASGAWCKFDAMGVGTCAAQVGAGEVCEDAAACTPGNACDPESGRCFKQAASGGSCNPDLAADGCAALAEICDPVTSTCVALPDVGKPCATNALFVEGVCAPWAACRDGSCVAMPVEGEPCAAGACAAPAAGALPGLLGCGAMDTCERLPAAPVCAD